LFGWIADIQSNGANIKRHLQDKLSEARMRGDIGLTKPS
jgi:hypothetical protein